jgi:hypothetical protein
LGEDRDGLGCREGSGCSLSLECTLVLPSAHRLQGVLPACSNGSHLTRNPLTLFLPKRDIISIFLLD